MNRRRRVLLAVTIDDSLQFLRGFPQYLVNRGWEVHVVSTPGKRLAELSEIEGVVTHGIKMDRTPNPLRDIFSFCRWLLVIASVRPDVVSVGTPKAGLLGSLAAWMLRVPARVYLLRGLRLETSAGLRKQLLVFAERMTMACASTVVSVSDSLRELAIEMRLAPSDKIAVLGRGSSNGVDVEVFRPDRIKNGDRAAIASRLGMDLNVPVVGFVGRLTRDKGLHVLGDAMSALERRGVNAQVLVLGGVDDESGANGVAQLRKSCRNIVTTGHVLQPADYYSLMTLLCLPSYREGFVNVVLEASASGIPVVTSDATGVRDAVVDGVTGLTSPVADADSLADNLARLLLDPTLAGSLGANGRKWVVDNFSRERVQDSYANHLEAQLGQEHAQ